MIGASPACTVCASRTSTAYVVSLHGELTCASHPVVIRCTYCARPAPAVTPGWWTDSDWVRCPTCSQGAVGTQAHVRVELPKIRAELATMEVKLTLPVKVRLISRREIEGMSHRIHTFGLTRMSMSPYGPVNVVDILVADGLPRIQFGRTVAHEAGHAWLAQHGIELEKPAKEEGFCELVAEAWLARQRGPFAEALRLQTHSNPDPVYGQGFREAWQRTHEQGLTTPEQWVRALRP